ncbi:MAG: hypothetical protein ABIM99_06080 [Candidatus Dojkabacteria bacterium]
MAVKKNNKKAYVTLISVIILGAISILVLTTTIAIDTESIFATDVMDQGKQAKAFADTCAERAIDSLKQNNTYTGTETVNFTSGSCTLGAVSGSGNSNRVFLSTGIFKNATRKVSVTVTTVNPTTVIGSWQEVQ